MRAGRRVEAGTSPAEIEIGVRLEEIAPASFCDYLFLGHLKSQKLVFK